MVDHNRLRQIIRNCLEQRGIDGNNEQNRGIEAVVELTAEVVLTYLEQEGGNHNKALSIRSDGPATYTLIDWLDQYAVRSHQERFLVIMQWLWEQEQREEFTTSDIIQMYEKARWKKPANAADVFAKGAERHWFAEADNTHDGLKSWVMTRKGQEHLQSLKKGN